MVRKEGQSGGGHPKLVGHWFSAAVCGLPGGGFGGRSVQSSDFRETKTNKHFVADVMHFCLAQRTHLTLQFVDLSLLLIYCFSLIGRYPEESVKQNDFKHHLVVGAL